MVIVNTAKLPERDEASERPQAEVIDHFNLRNFDLNLLLVFDALFKERSVTKAAARLRVHQPAVSHSLSNLRLLLQDDLFVRVGQIMQPTPRASSLAEGISKVLAQAHQLLLTTQDFEPLLEERTFRIGCYSEIEVLLIPLLAEHLRERAPHMRVHARTTSPDTVARMLDDQSIDLAVGCFHNDQSRFRRRELFSQSLMCCYNPKLLKLSKALTLKEYMSARHALVSQNQDLKGCLDQVFRQHDLQIDVAVAAPEFLSILAAVERAPFIATLPRWIVQRFAGMFKLHTCLAPFDNQLPPVVVMWSSHVDREPASEWLREQIASVTSGRF